MSYQRIVTVHSHYRVKLSDLIVLKFVSFTIINIFWQFVTICVLHIPVISLMSSCVVS